MSIIFTGRQLVRNWQVATVETNLSSGPSKTLTSVSARKFYLRAKVAPEVLF